MPVVETKDLVKRYRRGGQQVHALDGVTLSIQPGELIAIMGRSGSGKTTLLNLIGALDAPTSGFVRLGDVDLGSAPRKELPRIRREKVGFVFQHFNLIPTLTALENVLLPMKYARVPGSEARQRAMETMREVEMEHRLEHRPSELSGGEQQRVAIARALVNRPSVVLADEPTGEMDTQIAQNILRLMQRLNQAHGLTFLIVTHDPMVANHTRKIVRLKDGRIESITPVEKGETP